MLSDDQRRTLTVLFDALDATGDGLVTRADAIVRADKVSGRLRWRRALRRTATSTGHTSRPGTRSFASPTPTRMVQSTSTSSSRRWIAGCSRTRTTSSARSS